MIVSKTSLPAVLKIGLESFEDSRGIYVETYNEALYRKRGIKVKFVEDDYSRSAKNVLRGIHCDSRTWKLITCPYGKIYLVIVNCDRRSHYFGKWESFTLSSSGRTQVLVPPQHGVAHLVLSEEAVFQYKQSEYYDPQRQASYRWNDPRFKIRWPIKYPILSPRDRVGRYVS